MAHRVCDEGTACFIRNQAKKLDVSIEKVKKEFSKESGIPEGTLDRWLYPSKSSPKTGGTPKTKAVRTPVSKAKTAKSPSDLELLDRTLKKLKVDLQRLVERDKSILSDDEIKRYEMIRTKGTVIIRLFFKLGVDIEKTWNGIGGKNFVRGEVVDVEGEVVSGDRKARKELENGEEAAIETEPFDVVEAEGTVIN